MKKQYITPELSVIDFNTDNYMMIGSVIGTGLYDDPATPGVVLARRNDDYWNDEEDNDN